MDVEIQDGKIVEKSSASDVEEIDAEGRIVVPAGIDLHAHLGTNVAVAAGLFGKQWAAKTIAQEYLQAGFTFAATRSVSLLDAVRTHHFLRLIPGIDAGMFLAVGSLWMNATDYQQENVEGIAGTLAYFVSKLQSLGVEISQPFSSEYWHWAEENPSLVAPTKHFDIPPEKVVLGGLEGAQRAGLRSKVFVELPINHQATNLELLREHIANLDAGALPYHLVQGQFYAQGSETNTGTSITDLLNKHEWLSTDAGCANLTGERIVATTDRWLINSSGPSLRGTYELDQDIGAGIHAWDLRTPPAGLWWVSSLEILLSAGKRQQPAAFSFDSPNFGNPSEFGKFLTLLLSKPLRDERGPEVVGELYAQSTLAGLEEDLSIPDLIQVTRVVPATILGISTMKGHLGINADADVAILDLKPDDSITESSLDQAWVTIKGGQVVWKNNTLGSLPPSNLFASEINPDIISEDLIEKRNKWHEKYSSVSMSSLQIPMDEHIIKV
ncbi:MAG TPA: amidohydrolase family protein [Candidatus Lokiarchaeia archaeon]|nr:amidohydrolase family protein [Candidatus Lokiarchaeia archaeon]